MDFISIERLSQKAVYEQEVEMVERKGKGHPDTLADNLSEAVCRALCNYYMDKYGAILHHNVDKALVVGGRSIPTFGGGVVCEPIYVVVAGRAVTHVVKENNVEMVPIGSLAIEAMRESIKKTFRHLNPDVHVILDYKIKQGSEDLVKVFELGKGIPLANDTSFGVGYAPLTETEKLVLEVEGLLNSDDYKKKNPAVGEDIKVLAVRRGKKVDLTVACAMISAYINNLDDYLKVKEDVKGDVLNLASKYPDLEVDVEVNAADKPDRGVIYLTVTGTSAEAGDDGNTGRGNRANGLITPNRYMSLEAVAGKNPVSHIGKIYNIISTNIANRIYEETGKVKEVYVHMLSRIGKPINEPLVVSVKVIPHDGITVESLRSDIDGIVRNELENIENVRDYLLKEPLRL
ncbi:MAG: methionine adenosyltransferase [Thermoprotei archaeon]|nr:MAG: methionine adenosyltransferase [Thermoprotei archaeon]RLF23334.1 MAG: methionine adenosyltransferase [Thermoprotei archaeon]